MFGSGSTNAPRKDQAALGLQSYRASSAEAARPLPYIAGKQRIALTFISDVFNTRAVGVSSGGKNSTRTGYNYFTSFAAAACVGPVDALHAIFLNGEPVYAASTKIVIKSLTSVGGTATATTKNAHNLTTGDQVIVSGALQAEYNGTRTITVTASNKFTYSVTGGPASPATTGSNAQIFARVLLPPVFRDDDNPEFVDVTIPDYGTMRLYWGTETQEQDEYLQTSGVEHPAYRGVCYAIFNDLFIGFNQTSVQNVELVLGRYPASTWLEAQNINDDTNLVSFVADVLQHPRAGMALPDSRLDTATLIATAEDLAAEGLGISPLVTREQDALQVLVTAMEYADAFWSFTTDGKLGVKLIRPLSGSLPEITDGDMVNKPEFELGDWASAYNETRVKYSNRLLDYKEDAIGRPDAGARSITGEPRVQTVDRVWVTDEAVAAMLQRSLSRAAALPPITGKVKLRMIPALYAALTPGAAFRIDYSKRDLSLLTFRVDTRTVGDPAKPEFDITFKVDRSHVYA